MSKAWADSLLADQPLPHVPGVAIPPKEERDKWNRERLINRTLDGRRSFAQAWKEWSDLEDQKKAPRSGWFEENKRLTRNQKDLENEIGYTSKKFSNNLFSKKYDEKFDTFKERKAAGDFKKVTEPVTGNNRYYFVVGPTANLLKKQETAAGNKDIVTEWLISKNPVRGFGHKPKGVSVYGLRARIAKIKRRVWREYKAGALPKGYEYIGDFIPNHIKDNILRSSDPNWSEVRRGGYRSNLILD